MDISRIPRINISNTSELHEEGDAIDNDFAIFKEIGDLPLMDYPNRVEVAVLGICLTGYCRLAVNLKDYTFSTNQALIIMSDQIVQCFEISPDFSGAFIVVSEPFLDAILPRLNTILPFFLYLKDHSCIDLTTEQLNDLMEHHTFLWKKVKMTNNIFRKEVAQGLMFSFFYDLYNICAPYIEQKSSTKTRQQEIFEHFINEVGAFYKQERSVTYYAKKMYLTPKHLSWVVKETSGKTAGEWIDDFVILEAKALLKSSDMNIQQIAEDLHFANQSFFGKYFKHYVGMSPKEYRKR